MDWNKLISDQRWGKPISAHKNYVSDTTHTAKNGALEEFRTDFQRDFDRLIFSSPFRRLQNKTQVFPLPGSIFVHNRLTHSLEVSTVGRSLGTDAQRRCQSGFCAKSGGATGSDWGLIVSAACLAHDMGNTPFGHSGEKAIASFFSQGKGTRIYDIIVKECGKEQGDAIWNDIVHFDGNANTFRLLTHQFEGRREGGFVMTYSTLASIVKYPFTSALANKKPKFGFFQTERDCFCQIADSLGLICKRKDGYAVQYARHPLVYFVEAADDICYEIMDIEDAYKLQILTPEETKGLYLNFFQPDQQERILNAYPNVTDPNELITYLRACVINAIEQACVQVFIDHEDEILRGTFEGSLVNNMDKPLRDAFNQCVDVAKKRIYCDRKVLDVELAGYKIIYELLELLTDAVVSPEKAYSKLLLERVSSQYQVKAPSLTQRMQGVLDYISGMTDIYALDLYRKINGQSLPNI